MTPFYSSAEALAAEVVRLEEERMASEQAAEKAQGASGAGADSSREGSRGRPPMLSETRPKPSRAVSFGAMAAEVDDDAASMSSLRADDGEGLDEEEMAGPQGGTATALLAMTTNADPNEAAMHSVRLAHS